MEDQCTNLDREFYLHQEGLEDLKCSLLYTTLELEAMIVSAKEEITRRECESIRLNDLLTMVIKERDESEAKWQKLMLENLELQQELLHQKQKHSVLEASSDNSDSGGSSIPEPPELEVALELAEKKPLPEKGKLLKAVMEAGPLLQTLILAGPLPQWQHPPPQLHSIEIPPLAISSPSPCLLPQHSSPSSSSKKRDPVLCASTDDCLPNPKLRKIIHQ